MLVKIIIGLVLGFVMGHRGINRDVRNGSGFLALVFMFSSATYGFEYLLMAVAEVGIAFLVAMSMSEGSQTPSEKEQEPEVNQVEERPQTQSDPLSRFMEDAKIRSSEIPDCLLRHTPEPAPRLHRFSNYSPDKAREKSSESGPSINTILDAMLADEQKAREKSAIQVEQLTKEEYEKIEKTRMSCRGCTARILPATWRRNKGYCARCAKN